MTTRSAWPHNHCPVLTWDQLRTSRGRAGVEGQGIGARLLRKEDDRYMRGRGQYVGDIKLPGMLEVAFLRSPLAHARIRGIRIPPAIRNRVTLSRKGGDRPRSVRPHSRWRRRAS